MYPKKKIYFLEFVLTNVTKVNKNFHFSGPVLNYKT